jgi:phage repressor protein C with HTH and peptisase S24 domain
MSTIQRILKIIELKQISKREFYLRTGLSNGFLDKSQHIGTDKVEKILSVFPDVNLEWLILGRGEMLIKNAPESIPKSIPNSIPKAKKYPEMTVLAESDLGRYEGKSRTIPVLDARAAAGWPATIDGTGFLDQRPTISLPFGWFQSGEYVLLQIEGDSMHPTIYNGDWAFVRKIEAYNDIKDGYVHIILTRDGIVCKRVLNRPNKGHLALQSDNSAYPTYTVPYEEIISLWKVEMKMSAILRNENLDIIKRLNTMEADIAEMKVKKKG